MKMYWYGTKNNKKLDLEVKDQVEALQYAAKESIRIFHIKTAKGEILGTWRLNAEERWQFFSSRA